MANSGALAAYQVFVLLVSENIYTNQTLNQREAFLGLAWVSKMGQT
jgi:hypothetical protein